MTLPGTPAGAQGPGAEDRQVPAGEAAEVLRRVADLYAQWSRTGADIAERLRPGVGDDELDAAEEALGAALPAGARAWFRAVDGVEPVRTRYRTSLPSVGPGGWVPLTLAAAVRRAQERSPCDFGGRLPLFARAEEFLAVRLGRPDAVVDQLMQEESVQTFSRGWSASLGTLLGAWANALIASVLWLPDAHDWVVDPFSARALPHGHLLQ